MANTAAGSTAGGMSGGLIGGATSLIGAIPGILASALTPKDASAKTQAISNIGSAVAAPAAAVGAGAAGGAMAGTGAAAGAAAALPAAGLALPAIAMAIGMSVDAMRQEANVKQAIGKFKEYMASIPGMRQEWEQKIGNVDQVLNTLHSMDSQQLSHLVDTTSADYSGVQTAKSNALSAGGTTGSFDSHLPAAALNYLSRTPNAMSGSNDLIRQALLNDVVGRDEMGRRGLPSGSNPYYTPSDLALEFAPDYFKAHHNYDILGQNPNAFNAEGKDAALNGPLGQGPYAELLKNYWGAGGGSLDELPNVGRPFGMATEDVTSTHNLNSGDRNVWDPQSLALLQGMKPGNYLSTLEQMGFQPGPMGQGGAFDPASPGSHMLTGGFTGEPSGGPGGEPSGPGGPGGEAGGKVGRLQPRNVITGLQSLPRPESDARSEAVFGMRRPGVQGPADTSSGQAAPPPTPGTSAAEPRAFGQGNGFAIAPGGNIGTGGLVTQSPFGSRPARGNNGGM